MENKRIEIDLGKYKRMANDLLILAGVYEDDNKLRADCERAAAGAIDDLLWHLEFWLKQYKNLQEENKLLRKALEHIRDKQELAWGTAAAALKEIDGKAPQQKAALAGEVRAGE